MRGRGPGPWGWRCHGREFGTHLRRNRSSEVPTFPLCFFGWEGSPTKIDDREEFGTLILSSLLENLELVDMNLRNDV